MRRIDADDPLAVGAVRFVHNADGSVLQEVVTALEPPRRHAYRLSGFRPPFSWLVEHGAAEWRVSDAPEGAHVVWTYRFALTHPLSALPARLVLGFMQAAMRRCLAAMAADVACSAEPATP